MIFFLFSAKCVFGDHTLAKSGFLNFRYFQGEGELRLMCEYEYEDGQVEEGEDFLRGGIEKTIWRR